MDNISEQQNKILDSPPYSTPFNVDLFSNQSKGYFADLTREFSHLAESVKDVAINHDTAVFIEENLGPNFGLNAKQKTEFTRVLRDILLADLFWGDFTEEVANRLQIDMETANQVVRMTADQLLAPALEEIKEMQKAKFPDRIAQNRESPVQQPPKNTENQSQGNVINLRNRDNQ